MIEYPIKIFDIPYCYHWKKTFAWLPVKTVKGKIVWMKTVYRQRFWCDPGPGLSMEPEVEYAELFDILGQQYE